MEDLRLEEDEYLSFWVTNNAGIERLALDSPGDKSKNAQSPADDAGPGNVTKMTKTSTTMDSELNFTTMPLKRRIRDSQSRPESTQGGVPVESAAPEGPMTREEIIFKWLSGLKDDPHPLFSVDDRSPHELDWEAGDTVPQGWARTRPATGVPRQIPNYRFFDYTSGTYTDLHGAPPPV
ncbi:hypothetical protein KXW40_005042 [Aspergillus fumigatus]|nr:hypothetical protein KXW40_005042 [Aspergillus fumigatus]